MKHLLKVTEREIKLGFRNPWSYSFLFIFTVFSMMLVLIHRQNYTEGYTNTSSIILNLTLYLLPLMTLILGSFSLVTEKEDGNWKLLATYPLSTVQFILGKYIGLLYVLLTIVLFGFGLIALLSFLVGSSFTLSAFFIFFCFAVGLIFLFLTCALVIGALTKNRWQALTFSVAIWFIFVIGWPTILVTLLGALPFYIIQPLLVFLTLFNPAELMRLFVTIKLGGGSVLGPDYFDLVQWIQSSSGTAMFFVFCFLWIFLSLAIACNIWKRGRYSG